MNKTRMTPNGKNEMRTGTTGPSHDPYSVTTYTAVRNAGTAVLVMGIGVTLTINRRKIEIENPSYDEREREMVKAFERFTGQSMRAFEIAMHRPERCCNKPDPKSERGFPGETFIICQNCGKHIDYDFNEGAVL